MWLLVKRAWLWFYLETQWLRVRFFRALRPGFSPKVVVERIGSMGDVLLTTPGLKALREKFPASEIVYVTDDKFRGVLEGNPAVSRISNRRPADFDLLLRPCYEYHRRVRGHVVDLFCRQMKVDPGDWRLCIYVGDEDRRFAEDVIKRLGASPAVCLQVDARWYKDKEWEPERWKEVVEYLGDLGCTVIQLGNLRAPVVGQVNLLGTTTVKQFAALLERSLFFLGVESLGAHLAAAVGAPSVVLFGPTNPTVFGHSGELNLAVHKGLDDHSWFKRSHWRSPRRGGWMEAIEVEDVKRAIGKLMGTASLTKRADRFGMPLVPREIRRGTD